MTDVAIPAERNVMQNEVEMKMKYKSLCTEIKQMWNLKCLIIPVMIETTGRVTKGLRKNLEAILGKHSVDVVQKTAVLGTSHILQRVLYSESGSQSSGSREVSTGKGL